MKQTKLETSVTEARPLALLRDQKLDKERKIHASSGIPLLVFPMYVSTAWSVELQQRLRSTKLVLAYWEALGKTVKGGLEILSARQVESS